MRDFTLFVGRNAVEPSVKGKDRHSNAICVGLMGRPGGRRIVVNNDCFAKTGIKTGLWGLEKRHGAEFRDLR